MLQSLQLAIDFAIAPVIYNSFNKSINILMLFIVCFNLVGMLVFFPLYYMIREKVIKLPVDIPEEDDIEMNIPFDDSRRFIVPETLPVSQGINENDVEDENKRLCDEPDFLQPEYDLTITIARAPLTFMETIKDMKLNSWLTIVTMLFVGSGQLAVVGMAGNLLTKNYNYSPEAAGQVMGRYQLIQGVVKPFVVCFACYFGCRGIILAFAGILSSVCIFIMAGAGHNDGALVETMMIILPIMTGLYYPIFFNSVALTCNVKCVSVAMGFSLAAANFGQFIIPLVMGWISNSQTALSYVHAFLFLGVYVGIGGLDGVI